MIKKPVFGFSKQRFSGGKRVVTLADIETRQCPACKGTGKKTLAQVGNTFTKHSELSWWCDVCQGAGQIASTEATWRDLVEHYA